MAAIAKKYLPDSWWIVADVVDAFESDEKDKLPSLLRYVEEAPEKHRLAALEELVKVDCEKRWRDSEPKFVEEYIHEFPQLKSSDASVEDLVKQECLVRSRFGDEVSVDELASRFPQLDHQSVLSSGAETRIFGTLSFGFEALDTHRPVGVDDSVPGGTVQLDSSKGGSLQSSGPSGTIIVDSSRSSRSRSLDAPATVDHETARAGASETKATADSVSRRAARQADDDVRGMLLGRYQIIDRLGSGSFGMVYRCRDEDLKRDVAIKIPVRRGAKSAERVKEFLHEAQSVARLKHPGIVTVWDASLTEDGRVFIVYEFIEGDTIQNRLKAQDYEIEDSVRWIVESAEALQHAHANGIVHRDIKPANILLDKDGRACVADFGLATIDEGFFKDDTGKVVGTIAYMSPEQASGKSHWATPQTDIYALGVMLYQLLTGKLPFSSKSVNEALDQIKHREAPPPRAINESVPPELEEICLKAMAKLPGDRYRTAGDMAADLRATLAGAPPKNRTWMMAAAAGAAAAIVGMLLLLPKSSLDKIADISAREAVEQLAIKQGLTRPHMTIHYQHLEEKFVYHVLATESLSEGDKVQPHVLLSGEPKYIYVYWYDQQGAPQRLYPDSSQLDEQQPTNYWTGPNPDDEDKFWPLTGGQGLETLLLAVSDEPVDRETLEHFAAVQPYEDRQAVIDEVFHAGSEEITGELARGLGAVVTSQKHPLSSKFRETISETFGEYHAMVIPHKQ
jgi:serine/threonine protein kinase